MLLLLAVIVDEELAAGTEKGEKDRKASSRKSDVKEDLLPEDKIWEEKSSLRVGKREEEVTSDKVGAGADSSSPGLPLATRDE